MLCNRPEAYVYLTIRGWVTLTLHPLGVSRPQPRVLGVTLET